VRRDGRPFIDLTVSNPTRAGFDYLPGLLAPLADRRGLVYAPEALGLLEARRAVARDYAARGFDVDPARVLLTASTSDAYTMLFKLLADPGDEILVPRPSYPLFEHLTRLDGLVARTYDLDAESRWAIDFASLEAALTPRTRAVLVVSPNNPTGSYVSAAEMDRLAGLCAARGLAIVADEVFTDYRLEADVAPGQVLGRDDVLWFSLGGLSKAAGLPQVKLGWAIVGGPDTLAVPALGRLELIADTYLSVSTPVQAAAGELLEAGAAIRAQIAARTARNYARLRARTAPPSPCRALRADGGWYGVVRVPSMEAEEDLVIHLLESRGVLVHPGYFFDFPHESYVIVSLLAGPGPFDEGLDRILRHFDCTDAGR